MLTNTDLYYVTNSYKVFGNNNNTNCFNQEINSIDCAGSDYSFTIRDALYNFSDHLPVTLQLQTTQSLSIDDVAIVSPIEFVYGNMIDDLLVLKVHPEFISNQTLNVYDSIGKLIKTINTKNSIYINEDMSMLANGLYYIVLPQHHINPLKFVITH